MTLLNILHGFHDSRQPHLPLSPQMDFQWGRRLRGTDNNSILQHARDADSDDVPDIRLHTGGGNEARIQK